MPTEIIVRCVPGGLQAVNAVERDKLTQFVGREMMVKISQPRNLAFHRKFFALLGTAHEWADTEYNMEQFRAYVIVGAGYAESIGENIQIPRSISFASMTDDEFERLYQDVLSFICKSWVLDERQLNEIVSFM